MKLLGRQTNIIIFHGTKYYEVNFKHFDIGSSQLFDSWQWILWKIKMYSRRQNSSCYISASLYVTFMKLLGHQTSIIICHGSKYHDVKFKCFDMGSSQLFDFWQSEYCEKLTCILVNKFKLLYLRSFTCHLHRTFRPSNQYHLLSRHQI
jgi:hypothetical protein